MDADEIAEEVAWKLHGIDVDQLAVRAGPVRGRGYVHENEASYELLEEALQPYLPRAGRAVSERRESARRASAS